MAIAFTLLNTGSKFHLRIGFYFIAASAGLFCGYVSMLRIHFNSQSSFTTVAVNRVVEFEGYLVEDSVVTTNGETLLRVALISVESQGGLIVGQAHGKVLVIVPKPCRYLRGQYIFVKGGLRRFNSLSPEMYGAYVKKSDIRVSDYVKKRFEIRSRIITSIEERIDQLGYPADELFRALFLGVREKLSERIVTYFRDVGSSHILALSGLHVGVLYIVVSLLLMPVRYRSIRIACSSLIILSYLFLVGPKPSLTRASVMILLLGVASLIDRDFNPLNVLAISAFIILLIDPFSAFSLSFQLSFLALAGIFTLGRLISDYSAAYLPAFLRYPIAFSLGAQLATLPVVLFHFGFFYPLGFLSALLLTPLITLFLWSGLIFLFVTPFQSFYTDNILGWVMDILHRAILLVTENLRHVPYISVGRQNTDLAIVLGGILLVIVFFLPRTAKIRPVGT